MADAPDKILIVDDEEEITMAIGDYFSRRDTGIKPIVTNDPRMVFPLLAEHEDIRLILSDFRMPAINGLDLLLRVKAQYPHVKFIIMTAFGTPELRKEGLKRGAVRYIEKPFDIGELGRIVQEALKDSPSGFGGMIEAVQLEDIIQLIGLGQRTVTLNVTANEGRGTCFFVDGEIVHALCDNQTGEEAFYEIFNWTGGQFSLGQLNDEPQRTINQSWQGLLLEAARRQDEAHARDDNLMEDDEGAAPAKEEEEDGGGFDFASFEPDAEGPEDQEVPDGQEEEEVDEEQPVSALEDILAEPEVPSPPPEESEPQDSKAEKPEPIPEPEPVAESEADDDTPDGYELFRIVAEDEAALSEPQKPSSKKQTSPSTDSGTPLNEKVVGETLENTVNHFLSFWPKGKEEVPFSSLPLTKLSVNVRRHLFYRFHQLSMLVIRTEGAPFDFSNEKVIDAVRNLLQALRENWMINESHFRRMIHDAIRFDLARSIDPARALSQFLHEGTGGDANQMKYLLRALIEHELIDSYFEELIGDIAKQTDTRIHPRKIENFARAVLERRSEDEGYQATRQSMQRIFEIAAIANEKPPTSLHPSVLVNMLESRGLAQVADFMKEEKKMARKAWTTEDLDTLMDSYRYFSGQARK